MTVADCEFTNISFNLDGRIFIGGVGGTINVFHTNFTVHNGQILYTFDRDYDSFIHLDHVSIVNSQWNRLIYLYGGDTLIMSNTRMITLYDVSDACHVHTANATCQYLCIPASSFIRNLGHVCSLFFFLCPKISQYK